MFRFLSAALRLVLVLALVAVGVVATTMAVSPQIATLAEAASAETPEIEVRGLATRSKVFDKDGNEIARLTDADANRELLALEDIPEEVVQAVVAIEDAAFYEHPGVNLQAIARAAVENVGAGGISQGGSTITQQIIKNLVLTPEQTIERKVREGALAIRLEEELTKDEILELYLNTVYFGAGAYGVQAAAEVYWGVEAADLGWGESAMLAALISSPAANDPLINPDEARRQRNIVLNRLATLDLIDESEARFLNRTPLPRTAKSTVDLPPEDYFIDQVRQLVLGEAPPGIDQQFQSALNGSEDRPGVLGDSASERFDRVFRSGLRIYTTFDPVAQDQMLATQASVLPEDGRGFTMALASVVPSTGAVPAIVGGPGFDSFEYNIATADGGRQPGSSFKTFVMVAALEAGYVPTDSFDGRGPCQFPDPFAEDGSGIYEVNNFANSPGSVNTLLGLTTSSSNCGYVGLGQVVGIDRVIDVARRLGVTGEIVNVKSLPLGVQEVSPLDMASAYATIANGGLRNRPYFIERIEDADGNLLYEHQSRSVRAIEVDEACWAMDILQANVRGGTGTAVLQSLPNQPAGGKTGTTEDFGDAWFVGSTPALTTAVWMGHPDTNIIKMRNVGSFSTVTGGSYPAIAWGDFNGRYHADIERVEFPICAPFGRGGRFVQGDGEFGSFNVCNPSSPYPLDSNRDGRSDACASSTVGLEVCGSSGGFDERGNEIPLYCGSTNNATTGGPSGSAGQGSPDGSGQSQQQVGGQTLACPATHPRGFDSDGDGVIDICYP